MQLRKSAHDVSYGCISLYAQTRLISGKGVSTSIAHQPVRNTCKVTNLQTVNRSLKHVQALLRLPCPTLAFSSVGQKLQFTGATHQVLVRRLNVMCVSVADQ